MEPASPRKNGHNESFNGKLRDELLSGEIFTTSNRCLSNWRQHFNTIRPHSSLGYPPPTAEMILPPTSVLAYAPLQISQDAGQWAYAIITKLTVSDLQKKSGIRNMAFLSLDHRLIFIHIYKNAGTSVTNALSAIGRNELRGAKNSTEWSSRYLNKLLNRAARKRGFLLVPSAPLVKGVERLKFLSMLSNGHLTFRQFEENIDVSSFFTFAVVRNPWSWQVSLYNYARKNSLHFQHGEPQYADFNAYINWRCSSEVRLQKSFVIDHKFNQGTNYIMKYESLDENWLELGERLGLRLPMLPKLNISTDDDYRAYYTDETAELVGKTFRLDIEMFDYRFDH